MYLCSFCDRVFMKESFFVIELCVSLYSTHPLPSCYKHTCYASLPPAIVLKFSGNPASRIVSISAFSFPWNRFPRGFVKCTAVICLDPALAAMALPTAAAAFLSLLLRSESRIVFSIVLAEARICFWQGTGGRGKGSDRHSMERGAAGKKRLGKPGRSPSVGHERTYVSVRRARHLRVHESVAEEHL